MKNKTIFLFCLFCLSTVFFTPSALPQAYRGQIKFLEDLAIRQYERGDTSGAAKEFQRILRLDPNDAVALEYLNKMAASKDAPVSVSGQRIDQIISDITSVKNDLHAYEKAAKDLELLIRSLITENDNLYMALYKRTREVIALREKFEGTPYAKAYAEAMKDLPVDRVPQQLHRPDDILPENAVIIDDLSSGEINTLINEISELERSAAAGKTLYVERSHTDTAVKKALSEKRDTLVEKTIAVAEKQGHLERIKSELTQMNITLRQSSTRYAEAARKIDAYYTGIKEELAKKNALNEKMFNDLMADYSSKVKEIEELKNTIRLRDEALVPFKSELSKANERIEDLNKTLAERDRELAKFTQTLADYKKEMSQRDAIIASRNETIREKETLISTHENALQEKDKTIIAHENTIHEKDTLLKKTETALEEKNTALLEKTALAASQQETLSGAEKGLTLLDAEAAGIEKTVAQTTPVISGIEQNIGLTKDLVAQQKTMLVQQQEASTREAVHVNEIKSRFASDTATITLQENAIKTSNKQIKNLERRITELTAELGIKEQALGSAARKATEQKIADLEKKVSEKDTALAEKDAALKKNELELAQLRESLLNTANQVTSKSRELSSASEALQVLRQEVAAKTRRTQELLQENAIMQHDLRSLHPINDLTQAQDKDATGELEARLRASFSELTEAENQLTQARLETALLKEKLDQRDAEIAGLREAVKPIPARTINTYEAERKTLSNALVAKDEELSAIKEELRRAQEKLGALSEESQSLRQKNTELASALQSRKEETVPPPAPPQPAAVSSGEEDVCSLSLDLKEKEALISKLQKELASAEKTLQESRDQIKAFSEKRSVQEIKQEAITKLIDERDDKIAALTTQVYALKQDLSAVNMAQQELKLKTDDALSAKTVAENKLKSIENEISRSQVTITELRDDIKRTAALLAKKDKDHDATLAELKRANDMLDKKTAEIADLQERLDRMAEAKKNVKKP